jgi:hypothetical protein
MTPSTGTANPVRGDVHATRRGGARMEVSARVTLVSRGSRSSERASRGPEAGGTELHGWALNVSRGGVRVILEEPVPLGGEYDVTVTDANGASGPHHGRIVWVQDEPDGVVAGIEFRSGSDAGARGKP